VPFAAIVCMSQASSIKQTPLRHQKRVLVLLGGIVAMCFTLIAFPSGSGLAVTVPYVYVKLFARSLLCERSFIPNFNRRTKNGNLPR
jgi:hypothetical protein